MHSRPSDGWLNKDYKFGGKPFAIPAEEEEQQLSLSDIIPPPAIVKCLSGT
jgi:hypothetical protein